MAKILSHFAGRHWLEDWCSKINDCPLYKMILCPRGNSSTNGVPFFVTWRKFATVISSGNVYCLLEINPILPFSPIQELSEILVLQNSDWCGIQNVPIFGFLAILANIWSALTWTRNSWNFSQQNGKDRWYIIIELRSIIAVHNHWLDII